MSRSCSGTNCGVACPPAFVFVTVSYQRTPSFIGFIALVARNALPRACRLRLSSNVVLGRFEQLVRMYKGPPAHALTEEFYETDPKRDFARGFAIQTVGPLPIAFAKQMMAARGAWGWGMRRIMMDYNHWSAFGLLGEILPWADNRVTLDEEKDQYGLPVAHVTFNRHDNDNKLIEFAKNKTMEVMHAAGAQEVLQEARYAHLVGASRMGKDPAESVVDAFGRTHDIPNLF